MFRVMSPQGYLQRPGLRAEEGEIIRLLASHIHILISPRAWQAVNPDMSISLERAGIRWQRDTTLILAVGGGRVLNCSKAVHDALPDIRLVNVATLVSADDYLG